MFDDLSYLTKVDHGVMSDFECSVFKDVKTLLIDQIKSIQFDGKVECVLNGYPIGNNGYEMLEVEPRGLKFFIHTCITFTEFCQGKKSKILEINLLETMTKKTLFEMGIYTMDTSSGEI